MALKTDGSAVGSGWGVRHLASSFIRRLHPQTLPLPAPAMLTTGSPKQRDTTLSKAKMVHLHTGHQCETLE